MNLLQQTLYRVAMVQGGPQQRTAVIATVSPSSGDTEHSMSTRK